MDPGIQAWGSHGWAQGGSIKRFRTGLTGWVWTPVSPPWAHSPWPTFCTEVSVCSTVLLSWAWMVVPMFRPIPEEHRARQGWGTRLPAAQLAHCPLPGSSQEGYPQAIYEPHHPGPPGYASGARKTALLPPAAPKQTQSPWLLFPAFQQARLAPMYKPGAQTPCAPSTEVGTAATFQRVYLGYAGSSSLTHRCIGSTLTWGTSETRPRRLSRVSGTASRLGPVCWCTRWFVAKAQATPTLRGGWRGWQVALGSQEGLFRTTPRPSATHSSTRVVRSKKVPRAPRSLAKALCSDFTRPPQWRRQRQHQKHSPTLGIANR